VSLEDGQDSVTAPQIADKLCGYYDSVVEHSTTGNLLYILFKTDEVERRNGFSASIYVTP